MCVCSVCVCVSDVATVTVNAMSWYCTKNSRSMSQSDFVSMSNSICLFLGCLDCEESQDGHRKWGSCDVPRRKAGAHQAQPAGNALILSTRFVPLCVYYIIGGSSHKYHFCHDKSMLAQLLWQNFCRDKIFPQQNVCHNNKNMFCHDKTHLSWQK